MSKILKDKVFWVIIGVICLWIIAFLYQVPDYQEKKDEKPFLQYSFSPHCPLAEGTYSPEQIDEMAKTLELTKLQNGEYYKNRYGVVFVPEQVPVLLENKDKYLKEIADYWQDMDEL